MIKDKIVHFVFINDYGKIIAQPTGWVEYIRHQIGLVHKILALRAKKHSNS